MTASGPVLGVPVLRDLDFYLRTIFDTKNTEKYIFQDGPITQSDKVGDFL